MSTPKQIIPKRLTQHNGQKDASVTWHDGHHEKIPYCHVCPEQQGGGEAGRANNWAGAAKFGEKRGSDGRCVGGIGGGRLEAETMALQVLVEGREEEADE